jgi:hypothetical protein
MRERMAGGVRVGLAAAVFAAFISGCYGAEDSVASPEPTPPPARDAGADTAVAPTPVEDPDINEGDPGAPDGGPSVTFGKFTDPGMTPNPAVLSKYANLDPTHIVPKVLLDHAVMFFDLNKVNIPNKAYVTVVDFKPHSSKKRFFVVNMQTGAVRAYVVAHGQNSDPDWTGYATDFGNVPGSYKSSLGFVITGETYDGTHGRSLRLEGVSPTNSNMFDRAIVMHGASYVVEGATKQGRSNGCFALDMDEKDAIIDLLKDGTLLYADDLDFHP